MRKLFVSPTQAIKPWAKNSGIRHCDTHTHQDWTEEYTCEGDEILDETVGESISRAYRANLGFFSGTKATYDIIIGRHYEYISATDQEDNDHKKSSKGALDYLFLPLVSRMIMHWLETKKATDEHSLIKELIPTVIAFSLEIIRLTAGVALTLLLLPIIGLRSLCHMEDKSTPSMKHA